MFVVIARSARPDAFVWPGRRWLACADALVWPALVAGLTLSSPLALGLAGRVAVSVAGALAVSRLCRAWWRNERYRFTTAAWGRWLVWATGLGVLLKLAACAT